MKNSTSTVSRDVHPRSTFHGRSLSAAVFVVVVAALSCAILAACESERDTQAPRTPGATEDPSSARDAHEDYGSAASTSSPRATPSTGSDAAAEFRALKEEVETLTEEIAELREEVEALGTADAGGSRSRSRRLPPRPTPAERVHCAPDTYAVGLEARADNEGVHAIGLVCAELAEAPGDDVASELVGPDVGSRKSLRCEKGSWMVGLDVVEPDTDSEPLRAVALRCRRIAWSDGEPTFADDSSTSSFIGAYDGTQDPEPVPCHHERLITGLRLDGLSSDSGDAERLSGLWARCETVFSYGYLTVYARPRGSVYIDGEMVSDQTPMVNQRVAPGSHTVRVYYDGLGKFSETKRAMIRDARHVKLFFKGPDPD